MFFPHKPCLWIKNKRLPAESLLFLHQVADELFAITWEHVEDGEFDHGVAARLLAEGCTSDIDQHLGGEGRVVDAHVELEALVLRLAADTLADEVDAVAHVTYLIDRGDLEHVGLVAGEIGVGLDGCSDGIEGGTILELDIDHAAMDALAEGDGHRQGILHTLLGTGADTMSHGHARTEIGVAEATGSEALHQRAHNRVAARIPSGSNDADGIGLLTELHQRATVIDDAGMDVEGIDGVDAQGQNLLGILLARTGGGGQDGYIDITQLTDVTDYLVLGELGGFILSTMTAHHACNLEIGC